MELSNHICSSHQVLRVITAENKNNKIKNRKDFLKIVLCHQYPGHYNSWTISTYHKKCQQMRVVRIMIVCANVECCEKSSPHQFSGDRKLRGVCDIFGNWTNLWFEHFAVLFILYKYLDIFGRNISSNIEMNQGLGAEMAGYKDTALNNSSGPVIVRLSQERDAVFHCSSFSGWISMKIRTFRVDISS